MEIEGGGPKSVIEKQDRNFNYIKVVILPGTGNADALSHIDITTKRIANEKRWMVRI